MRNFVRLFVHCSVLLVGLLAADEAWAECGIDASRTPSYLGDTAAFTLRECGETSSVAWEFGDGSQATVTGAARHLYAGTGTYTIFARVPGRDFPLTLLHTVLHRPTSSTPFNSSTLIHDVARQKLWNVNADNHSVTIVHSSTYARLAEIRVGRNPRTLALDSLGRVWVVNQEDASLSVIDGASFQILHTLRLPYASRPFGIVFAPGGKTGYVTLQGTGRLVRLNALTFEITGDLEVFPTPRGLALTHDGTRILVTRFISPVGHGEMAVVHTAPFALSKIVSLQADRRPDSENNGSGVPNALASVTISPDGRRAWIPFKKDNTGRGLFANPALGAPTFESTVRTGVIHINLDSETEDTTARVDLDNRSRASAVAFDREGAFAYVATLTSNHTAIYNNATGLPSTSIEPLGLDQELGPDGLVLDPEGKRLFIHYFISRELGVHDVSAVGEGGEPPRLTLVRTVTQDSLTDQVLKGKRLFYNASDPRMARDRYISCAVCHLDDGSDGRVWDFTHKGEGLRRTTSLLGRSGMGHGPVHWTGNFDEIHDFEHDVRVAFGGFGFLSEPDFAMAGSPLGVAKAGRSPDLDALAAYVASLARVNPSPFRKADGSMTDDALEGEKIFNSTTAGCAACHVPPRYTDSDLGISGFLVHDVGTLKPGSGKRLSDTLKGLDTPTLLGIWEMGPYLHDGSAATLMDVITNANPEDKHGKTSHLTLLQKNQLVAFLRQLDQGSRGPVSLRPHRTVQAGKLLLRRVGAGYEISWRHQNALGMSSLRIVDFRGKPVALLRASNSGDPGAAPTFQWGGAGEAPIPAGAYAMRLEWAGGYAVQRIFISR